MKCKDDGPIRFSTTYRAPPTRCRQPSSFLKMKNKERKGDGRIGFSFVRLIPSSSDYHRLVVGKPSPFFKETFRVGRGFPSSTPLLLVKHLNFGQLIFER